MDLLSLNRGMCCLLMLSANRGNSMPLLLSLKCSENTGICSEVRNFSVYAVKQNWKSTCLSPVIVAWRQLGFTNKAIHMFLLVKFRIN